MTKTISLLLILGLGAVAGFLGYKEMKRPPEPTALERGRYLVQIGGCHDCHTPGYAENFGKAEEAKWLTGDVLGWQGPWGTTYPINLRLYMQTITEEQWLPIVAAMKSRPPMPYYNMQKMSEQDLRAMYQYIRSLGPAGTQAPPYLAPNVAPATPVFRLTLPAAPPAG